MKKFKFTAKLLAASVTAITLAVCANAVQISDISGHWSETYVKYGIENEYINGYPDGTFLPDKPVTRAEFAKMMNSAVGFTETAETKFSDIEEDKWYFPEVEKAVWAEYIVGYEDGTFRAGNLITRQEAAVMLSRIATRADVAKTVDSFPDSADVASWAKQAFDYVYSKGFFGGDDLGNLNPKATLTRAQAAKILYELKIQENVRNKDYTIALDNAICSETVFTDDVYFTADGEDASLVLDGCTVAGTLYIRTKNACTVTIEDTKIKEVYVYSADSKIILKNGASVKTMNLPVYANVSGDCIKKLVLKGNELASGTTVINSSPDNVEVYSDAVIKTEKLPKLSVADSVSLTLQNGSVENMTVEKSAKGSVITLSAGVEVEDLTVNAASSFMGSGKIKNAKNSVSGVTYTTKPENITGTTTVPDDDDVEEKEEVADPTAFAPSTMQPGKNETDVNVTVNPYFAYNTWLYDADGKSVSAGYIQQNVEIRRSKENGVEVDFEVDLTSPKTFELNPDGNLSYGTKYYIIIPAGIFTDADGKKNAKVSYWFETKENSSSTGSDSTSTTAKTITYSPKNKEEDVSVSKNITVTFSTGIRCYNGDELDAKYLKKAFELRKGSKSGDTVEFTASINSSKKTVTINPDEDLKAGTDYYVIIKSGTLEYNDGTNISSQYSYFTTKDSIGITTTPENNATGVALDTEIVVKFDCEVFADDGEELMPSDIEDAISLKSGSTGSSGKLVDYEATISNDNRTITITPKSSLAPNTNYYIVIPAGAFINKNETENTSLSNRFTTIRQMQPAISPTGDNVSTEEIVISFNEPVYKDNKKTPIDADYIKKLIEDGDITLYRKGYTTNLLENPRKVEISEDLKTITIIGGASLVSGRTYVVTVDSYTFYNSTASRNVQATGTFSTLISGSPKITPTKMTDGLAAVDTKITITFDSAMKTSSGNTLYASDIQSKVVTIYKGSEDGESIAFNASISSDKKTITVTPKAKLEGETTYFVVVNGQTMLNADGEYNGGYSYSFVTDEAVVTGCEITTVNKKDSDVPVTTDITIEFYSSLYRKGGKTGGKINIEYLKSNNVITLKDKSSNAVEFDIAISDDCKVITLTPKEPLELNRTYYVNVLSGNLYYFDGTQITKTYSESFTTVKVMPSIEELVVSDVTDKQAAVTVIAAADGNLTLSLIKDDKEEVIVDGAILKEGDEKKYTLSDLASDTEYTVKAVFVDNNGTKTEKKAEFETEKSKVVEFKVESIEIDVDGDGDADYSQPSGEEVSFTIFDSTKSIKLSTVTTKDAVVSYMLDGRQVNNGTISVESGKKYVVIMTASAKDNATEKVSTVIHIEIK